MRRLSWNGSLEAQRQHEAALKVVSKPRRQKRGKKKDRRKVPGEFKVRGRETYRQYLKTSWWKKRRAIAIERADGKCQQCGSPNYLEVHHKNYARVWREEHHDLQCLCRQCHEANHRAKDSGLSVDEIHELNVASQLAAIL